MKNKIIGIFVCLMLIVTIIPLSLADTNEPTIYIANDNTWMQTYGRFFNDEMGLSVQQTDDGGFIVVGAKSRSLIDIHSHRDVWLIKLDETGSVIWDKTFGGWDDDVGSSVQQTLDGGYIITGYTKSYSNGKNDVWLIKTDENGLKIWDKTFGYGDFDSGSMVRQTSDGGYIMVGDVNTSGGGLGDVLLIKVDTNGEFLWDRSFGGKGHNYADEIQQTQDEGYIIIGSSWIPDESNSYDMWLIKVDKNGNMMWDKKFNRSESDHGWSIDQTVDGGFIIAGETNHGSEDKVWLLKTDESGNKIWDKTFEGRGFSVQQTNEGGYIIAGAAMNPTKTDFSNGLLIKTDSNGEQEWRKTFGGRKPDFLFSVQQTTDNGYIITGHTNAWFGYDLWLVKTDSEGNAPKTRFINLESEIVKEKAKDVHDAESDWPEPLQISMPKNKKLTIPCSNPSNSIWFVRGLFKFLEEDEEYIYLKAISAKLRGFGNGAAVYHLFFCPIKISKPFYGFLSENSILLPTIGICKEWEYMET